MIQGIIVITLVVIVIWLAISNALLRIKNDIVTAELRVTKQLLESATDQVDGKTLRKIVQNWRDEDARINNSVVGYDNNNSTTGDVDIRAMADDTKAE